MIPDACRCWIGSGDAPARTLRMAPLATCCTGDLLCILVALIALTAHPPVAHRLSISTCGAQPARFTTLPASLSHNYSVDLEVHRLYERPSALPLAAKSAFLDSTPRTVQCRALQLVDSAECRQERHRVSAYLVRYVHLTQADTAQHRAQPRPRRPPAARPCTRPNHTISFLKNAASLHEQEHGRIGHRRCAVAACSCL